MFERAAAFSAQRRVHLEGYCPVPCTPCRTFELYLGTSRGTDAGRFSCAVSSAVVHRRRGAGAEGQAPQGQEGQEGEEAAPQLGPGSRGTGLTAAGPLEKYFVDTGMLQNFVEGAGFHEAFLYWYLAKCDGTGVLL